MVKVGQQIQGVTDHITGGERLETVRTETDWMRLAKAYFESQDVRPLAGAAHTHAVKRLRSMTTHIRPCRPVPDGEGFMGYSPPPIEDILAFSEAFAPHFDLAASLCYDELEPVAAWLAAQIEELAPSLAVDVGCGTGLTACFLAKMFPDVRFKGYDFAKAMLVRAIGRAKIMGIGNAEFFVADHQAAAERISGADLVFEYGTLVDLPNMVPDFLRATAHEDLWGEFLGMDPFAIRLLGHLDAFARMLKLGGRFFMVGRSEGIVEFLRRAALRKGLVLEESRNGRFGCLLPEDAKEGDVIAISFIKSQG